MSTLSSETPLYNLHIGDRFILAKEANPPVEARPLSMDVVYTLGWLDGMYCNCFVNAYGNQAPLQGEGFLIPAGADVYKLEEAL